MKMNIALFSLPKDATNITSARGAGGWGGGRNAIMLPLFFIYREKQLLIFMLKTCQDTYIFHSIKSYFFILSNCSLRFQNQICLLAKYLCNMNISHWLIIIGFLVGSSILASALL